MLFKDARQVFYSSFCPVGTLVARVLTVYLYSLIYICYSPVNLTSTYEVIFIIQTGKLLLKGV